MTTKIVTKDLAGLKTSVSLVPSDDNILSEKAAVDYVATISAGDVTVAGTQTLTNKRITRRFVTINTP
jgi:hypothetical protein